MQQAAHLRTLYIAHLATFSRVVIMICSTRETSSCLIPCNPTEKTLSRVLLSYLQVQSTSHTSMHTHTQACTLCHLSYLQMLWGVIYRDVLGRHVGTTVHASWKTCQSPLKHTLYSEHSHNQYVHQVGHDRMERKDHLPATGPRSKGPVTHMGQCYCKNNQ